jgi:hypothetical protein
MIYFVDEEEINICDQLILVNSYFILQAVLTLAGQKELDKEKQMKLQNFNPNVLGGEQEEKVYNQLRKSLQENDIKNTVVVNGWKDRLTQGNTAAEFDFLIVSEPFHTIFHVEVKTTCNTKNAFKAAEQLENGFKLINNNIPFPEKENWKYVGLIYFARNEQKKSIFCAECQKYIIGPSKDIWSDITKNSEQPSQAKSSNKTYLSILKFLLYEMFKQESCATTQQLIKETRTTSDKMSTTKNIFFWSKEQLKVIKATKDAKRVALTSEFGTGKTILLREKAMEILGIVEEKGTIQMNLPEVKHVQPNIIFVIFEGGAKDTILKQESVAHFSEKSVTVLGITGSKGNNWKLNEKVNNLAD